MRHGDYNKHGFLTETGKKQVLKVIGKVVEKTGNLGKTVVFSSGEIRALDSALLAMKYLKENHLAEINQVRIGNKKDSIMIEEFNQIIEEGRKDNILWFAHYEEIGSFAPHFREGLPRVLHQDNHYGTTMIIDIETNTAEIIQEED